MVDWMADARVGAFFRSVQTLLIIGAFEYQCCRPRDRSDDHVKADMTRLKVPATIQRVADSKDGMRYFRRTFHWRAFVTG
jgi:hypothetical protein